MVSPNDVDERLSALDAADQRLRVLYRSLADNLDLAEAHDSEVRELLATRRSLAERVGLAMLAQRRARTETPVVVAGGGNGDGIASPAPEAISSEATSELPASADIIDQWKRVANEKGLGQAAYEDHFAATWHTTLDNLMARLGPPRDLDVELADELDALDRISRQPAIGDWALLRRDAQQFWLGMLVARTRAIKLMTGLHVPQKALVRDIIGRYPRWASEQRPGHVHGLRLDHEAVHGTWSRDGQSLWEALKTLLDDERPKAAICAAKKKRVERDEPADTTERPIDPAWPFWSVVRGRRAMIVGGDPREPNRKRLERMFEFESLEWPDISGPRRVDAVVARIKRRTVDIVFVVTGFVDHTQSEPIIAAAKESKVAWALSESYGGTAVKAGLERFLAVHSRPCGG